MSSGYIYLLQPLCSIKDNKQVYKIGKTKRNNFKRFNEYPVGSILLLQSSCKNCDLMENHLLKLFNERFAKETDYGREYFQGGLFEMKKLINSEIMNEENIIDYDNNNNNIEESDYLDREIIKNVTERIEKYICEKCNYITNVKSNYIKHCLTAKHKNVMKCNVSNGSLSFSCRNCDKVYKSNVGLWRHSKVCIKSSEDKIVTIENPSIDTSLFIKLIQQNENLQNLLIQQATEYAQKHSEQAAEYAQKQSELMNKLIEREPIKGNG